MALFELGVPASEASERPSNEQVVLPYESVRSTLTVPSACLILVIFTSQDMAEFLLLPPWLAESRKSSNGSTPPNKLWKRLVASESVK